MGTRTAASNAPTGKRDIGVVGYFGQGNLGDDVLACHALETLIPECGVGRLVVSGPAGCYLEKWYPGIRCRPRGELSRDPTVDKIVFAGGGQFAAFPPARWTNLFGLRQASFLGVLLDLWRRGRPEAHCFAYCVGVGPVAGWGGRRGIAALFTRFDQISVRDEPSRDILRACHVRRVRVVSDPPFAWPIRRGMTPAPDRTLGIVVRGWSHATNVWLALERLRQMSVRLRDCGWQVDFISFQKHYQPEVIAALEPRPERVVVWDPDVQSIDAFVAGLSRYKVMITLRAHALILRSLMNLPCLSLRLEPKLEILAREAGQERFVLDLNCSPEVLHDAILEAHCTSMNMESDCQRARERVACEAATLVDWIRRHS
jgi:polysaccharide pyruvyl transferase WcaK-like protein